MVPQPSKAMASVSECETARLIDTDMRHGDATKSKMNNPVTSPVWASTTQIISLLALPGFVRASDINPDNAVIPAPLANECKSNHPPASRLGQLVPLALQDPQARAAPKAPKAPKATQPILDPTRPPQLAASSLSGGA